MRLLLDEHLPIGLAAELPGHTVDTVSGRGWSGIKNGELLRRISRGIEFQQRISTLPFGIPGHCDPTVNLYDWYVWVRGNRVERLWPITGVLKFSQPEFSVGGAGPSFIHSEREAISIKVSSRRRGVSKSNLDKA